MKMIDGAAYQKGIFSLFSCRFRCMDLDGDGYLSMYELEYFYEEQLQRLEQLGIETLPFEDCLCQVSSVFAHSLHTHF